MDSCFALLGVHQQVSEDVTLKFMCVGPWAGITYLPYTVLMSPKTGETAVHCCDPALSVLVMLVSRKAFHIVSALQPIVCLNTIFWLIRSLVDRTLAAIMVCGPLDCVVFLTRRGEAVRIFERKTCLDVKCGFRFWAVSNTLQCPRPK